MPDILNQIDTLFTEQLQNWEQCKKGYETLKSVQTKSFSFPKGITINTLYNEGRMTSTSAKVDSKSIAERKCFLCSENLPKEQKGLQIEPGFTLLVNPFPIFPMHFTIASDSHQPQRIEDNFSSMLNIAEKLGGKFTVFYNGPLCGASAPDHLHFQAGTANFMPIEEELNSLLPKAALSMARTNRESYFVEDGLRSFICYVGHETHVRTAFTRLFKIYSYLIDTPADSEAPINLLCKFDPETGHYTLVVFLRKKHRPWQFTAEGDSKYVVSPASVDLGGALVLPRLEDFNKIDSDFIKDIYSQVIADVDFAKEVFFLKTFAKKTLPKRFGFNEYFTK